MLPQLARLSWCAVIAIAIGAAEPLHAQTNRAWTAPFPPFRISGNLYYVGSEGLASYLITTSDGDILINTNLESSVPLIRDSIEKLGFKFGDIKILLISHAHFDHCAGSAQIKQLTGAEYMVMDADVPVIESGGKADFHYGQSANAMFPVTKVDRVLHDGDKVKLGDAELVAHLTPGHTKGCTTWTMKTIGRRQNLRCGDHRQPQCECRLPAGEQRGVSANRGRLREIVSHAP